MENFLRGLDWSQYKAHAPNILIFSFEDKTMFVTICVTQKWLKTGVPLKDGLVLDFDKIIIEMEEVST